MSIAKKHKRAPSRKTASKRGRAKAKTPEPRYQLIGGKLVTMKRICKVGNSAAILLDKPALDVLGIAAGDMVEVEVADKLMTAKPVRTIPRPQFNALRKEILKKYGKTFEILAR
ncbi:MAG: hypothetical protein L6Q71_00595 [Planctomycetes bacterium]|nr:hypothetical protein [Planctomycetota bacterium]NUQ35650.1 hypothetical protein [Planctomycetaceae bacterium]